ncbi:MAG: NAD(P)/FAD-dependent oxidoreductase, partial [Cyanobacteria bacterium J06659_2]
TQLYPGIRDDIECIQVTTPLNYEQSTGNWQGSICGWALNKDTLPLLIKGVPKTLPNLQRFYMAGQWVEPGGSLPIVAMSGRTAIQQICAEDIRPFKTQVPDG